MVDLLLMFLSVLSFFDTQPTCLLFTYAKFEPRLL